MTRKQLELRIKANPSISILNRIVSVCPFVARSISIKVAGSSSNFLRKRSTL